MKNLNYTLFLVASILLLNSCTKEFDEPTAKTIPVGTVMTIAEVRALHVPGYEVKITQDISVYGVVTADESTGNLYKESYIQDETGALYLRFTSSTGLYIGDSVRININGAKILKYNEMLQIDSLHADNSVFKIKTQQYRTPQIVTIDELVADVEGFQGKLIQLDGVFFVEGGLTKTYADGVNKESVSRVLQDAGSNQIDVRTSGYANFANDTLPAGSGTFIGISTQYLSSSTNPTGLQLLIRTPSELRMTGSKPIFKHFNDSSLTSGGWTVQHISGPSYTEWGIFAATNSAAKISCYNSGTGSGVASESWLISPAINLSSSTAPYFNFRNVVRYGLNPQLKVMVSTDYDGTSNPNTATWVDLTSQATWDTDINSWSTWTSSGNLSLTPYISSTTYIAFQHIGINASGVGTWEVDDIGINP